jgi:hypothetical protein
MIYELKEKKETLDQVTCLKCLTKIFEFKKKYVDYVWNE